MESNETFQAISEDKKFQKNLDLGLDQNEWLDFFLSIRTNNIWIKNIHHVAIKIKKKEKKKNYKKSL